MLKAPFVYHGGKSTIAEEVWKRFGKCEVYVEPFLGSAAVLLGCPYGGCPNETVNDIDAHLTNFWRAVRKDPFTVAEHAAYPSSELDLEARQLWLVTEGAERIAQLRTDPEYCDLQGAGWWLWGTAQFMGEWCRGTGMYKKPGATESSPGVNRTIPILGRGIFAGSWVHSETPDRDHLRQIQDYLTLLQRRLYRTRIICGDWERCLRPSITDNGLTAVFLDPPYPFGEHCNRMYNHKDDCAHDVQAWAVENGNNPLLRIAFCGYREAHKFPKDWTIFRWKTAGGYSGIRGTKGDRGPKNAERETVWFSPHCLDPTGGLLDGLLEETR